jgi:cytochrome c biogenesis protein CcmG/thiol:disulfide interchange protein DsbE
MSACLLFALSTWLPIPLGSAPTLPGHPDLILAISQSQPAVAPIAGHIRDYKNHKPIKGMRLRILGKSAVTDDKGYFRFEGLPAKGSMILEIGKDLSTRIQGGDMKIERLERDSSFTYVKVGDQMPKMHLGIWLNSKRLDLAALKGKVVLLDFWSVTCRPCCDALPSIEALAKKYAKSVVVIGVHTKEINARKLGAFARANNLTYPLAIDKGGDGGEFTDVFVTGGLPTLAVIDQNGQVVLLPDTLQEAQTKIDDLLASMK